MWLTRHHPSARPEKRSFKKPEISVRAPVLAQKSKPTTAWTGAVSFAEFDLIRVGLVKKPREDGWVRVKMHTDHPDRFSVGSHLLAESVPGHGLAVRVVESRNYGPADELEVRLAKVDSGEPCNPLLGHALFIERSNRKPAPSGSFYPDELEGMSVMDSRRTSVGLVVRLESETPAPYLVVSTDQHGELLIPFHEKVIADVSRVRRCIRLSTPIEQHVQE